ncbi:response regulator [Urbifossiella limnaea]|uniref:Response regulator MprA n=1 Tax=Urbifossiella limnaea TaxID=2528023 RepID=A0A517XUM2_9BACT|nr:response regulator [Urbifossiella limnaea]QDU21208.1 Response regulator MprA [Urbifossiella limnaea]
MTAAPLRVLCVDDHPDTAESLGTLLTLNGYDVQTATDGEKALARAPGFRPQACVLDITMPGIDGNELARRFRTEPGGGDMLLVALTALGDYPSLERMADSGFDLHFTKPVALAELFEALRDFTRSGRPGAAVPSGSAS